MRQELKVTIALDEVNKYKKDWRDFTLSYSDDRNEYNSDEEFANFSLKSVGKLKDKSLKRAIILKLEPMSKTLASVTMKSMNCRIN